MPRKPKSPAPEPRPKDVWGFIYWAKHCHGVLVSLETNTSMHGGTDVRIWIRGHEDIHYDHWTEKTQMGMPTHAFERWCYRVEALSKEYKDPKSSVCAERSKEPTDPFAYSAGDFLRKVSMQLSGTDSGMALDAMQHRLELIADSADYPEGLANYK